ncbi:YitT family protein [Ornithinibacillus sp. L9]|uniref:YitT family protein n=1 Tax=Ornithinibacillus caprae TaxID=2678566 RepID=A0A6N8FQN7_9BACI|nr:YitT family protein [Ornithinibacillus caprae]MUK90399.1 YitT family protein [Ornithinibacillus caprae]
MRPFWKKHGLVMLGGICQGFGMGVFLFPQSIPSGGAGGIAILLNHFLQINMGPALWIVNFSLMLLGIKYLGKRFTLWTLIGITMTSLAIDFFETHFVITHRNLMYDLVIGSFFLGTGIGILMRNNVSNGGVGVVAVMISHGRNILPGKPLFYMNSVIFLITAAVISWEIIFLALISQWISTTVIDLVCRIDIPRSYSFGWRKKP